ncbi:MAG TPA: peptidoglycan bridge formation glycyltransferase FemA/FemB family protein [Terriglobia bacterium]|nr:peptidoglycan bridge formation glycyltransferase FemA/FemB family protein [Terriglobia bacterium]
MTQISNNTESPATNQGGFLAVRQACYGSQSETRIAPQDTEYSVKVDSMRKSEWDGILQMFDDSSLMQTWSYGSIRWGEKNLSHVVLRKNGEIVAASEAVLIKAPYLPISLAYVKWGPCWRVRGRTADLNNFRRIIQTLYQIYVVERGLLLRIFPNEVEGRAETLRTILQEEGFQKDSCATLERTLLVDLSHPLGELRQSLKGTWRRNLILAERSGLKVARGTDDEIFQDFMTLYQEMKKRKKWEEIPDARYFERIQKDLPPPLKMICMVCKYKGEAIAGIGVAKLGNTAVALLGATGNKGLKLRGSYLLHWEMLQWLKSAQVRWYDLFGINQSTHPGTYQFKSGLGGKLSLEMDRVGAFQAGGNLITRLSIEGVETGQAIWVHLKRSVGR